jgi:hypothetical protein
MKTSFCWHLGLGLLLVALLLPAGCASSGAGSQGYEYEESSPGAVPPSYYGGSSTLEYWFTPPYWQPEAR